MVRWALDTMCSFLGAAGRVLQSSPVLGHSASLSLVIQGQCSLAPAGCHLVLVASSAEVSAECMLLILCSLDWSRMLTPGSQSLCPGVVATVLHLLH